MATTTQGLALVASRSGVDTPWRFPPTQFVHGDTPHEELLLGPKGVLYTYSVVHTARDARPYALAMVDFEPGVRAFGPMHYEPGHLPPLGAYMRVVPHTLADGSPDYAFEQVQGVAP